LAWSISLSYQRSQSYFEQTHSYIVENHQDVFIFATVFMGTLDPKTGILTYINAGHEDLYIMDQNTVKAALKRTGPAVGAKSKESFKISQIYLNPGDILFGYTDGVTDAKNPHVKYKYFKLI
jgi:phosphoserine phosphatase RsbU/P